MSLLAFDCETFLIPDRTTVVQGAQKVNTSPYVTPKLVLGSYASNVGYPQRGVISGPDLATLLRVVLSDPQIHVIGHHLPFDLDVVCTAFPDLWPLFREALRAGRVHDTKVLDVLYRLASGWYDTPQPENNWAFPELKVRSLDALTQAYLNRSTPKDLVDEQGDAVRLSYSKWDGVAIDKIPRLYYDYALSDAVSTLDLWQAMIKDAPLDLWGEPAQTRAEVAMYSMDKIGLCIDRFEAERLHALFSKDIPALQAQLVSAGFAQWLPTKGTIAKSPNVDTPPGGWALHGDTMRRASSKVVYTARPSFHLYQSEIRSHLLAFATLRGIPYKKTPTGDLSLTAEDWKDVIPADMGDLRTWLQHARLQKILTTYLSLYSRVTDVFPKIRAIGARSGRMSYASPNTQNVSKNKHGIRSLFVPHFGYVFVKADYAFQELVTLVQAMFDLGIKGPLYEAIQRGDPHTTTASLIMGVDPATIGKKSPERQAAKAVNFGVPGGLGPRKLADYARKTYGVTWTLEQAAAMRKRFLAVYPDIAEFLSRHKTSMNSNLRRVTGRGVDYWRAKLGARDVMDLRLIMSTTDDRAVRQVFYSAERGLTIHLLTGFTRKGCSFTEGANTHFQGLAAAVTKEAVWRFFAAGHRPVLVVHDEIVAECPADAVESTKAALEYFMLSAFSDICPDAGGFAKVEVEGPLYKWGEATDKEGRAV